MLVFGYEALVRWRAKARDKRYQTWRFVSSSPSRLASC